MNILLVGWGKMGGAFWAQGVKDDSASISVVAPAVSDVPNGARLYKDIGALETKSFDLIIVAVKPQMIDVSNQITSGSISPSAKRVAVSARGDIWSNPAENGTPRNMSRTSGTAERSPSWSPDGRWIAYFSDETGEYELYVTQSDGKGETKQLTSGSETFYNNSWWSPDSKHILFTDKAGRWLLHTIESGETIEMDRDPFGNAGAPVFMAHGRADPMIPIARAAQSRARLEALGYEVRWQEYPMGHEVCLPELEALASWITER